MSWLSLSCSPFWKNWNYFSLVILHHHHVMPQAWISLTLSRHFSRSFIASGRSSGLHPVSSHSCWIYVRAGRPAFARPYVGVHRSTSLISSSLLLQQCPAWLVPLTWIVFLIGGWWPYSWCHAKFKNRQNSRDFIQNINIKPCRAPQWPIDLFIIDTTVTKTLW